MRSGDVCANPCLLTRTGGKSMHVPRNIKIRLLCRRLDYPHPGGMGNSSLHAVRVEPLVTAYIPCVDNDDDDGKRSVLFFDLPSSLTSKDVGCGNDFLNYFLVPCLLHIFPRNVDDISFPTE